jgi:hypothetical protein
VEGFRPESQKGRNAEIQPFGKPDIQDSAHLFIHLPAWMVAQLDSNPALLPLGRMLRIPGQDVQSKRIGNSATLRSLATDIDEAVNEIAVG